MTYLVVALAVGLRIAWVLAVPSKPVGDFAMYLESAAHLVEHGSFDPEYVYMPGYVLLIAPVQALGGGWLATKLLGAVLGGLGAAGVAGITARLCASRRAGLLAGLLYALWPAGIALASVTGTDMPAAVLVILASYALIALSPRRPWLAALVFGLGTGLGAYVRAIGVPLAGLAVLVFRAQGQTWRRSLGYTATACAVALLVLAPWAVRNRLRYGEIFFTDSHGGLTALVGANPNTDGCYSRSLNRMFHDVTGFTVLAEPHRAADRAAFALAKDWSSYDPAFTLGLLASKAERLLVHERALLYWPLFRAGVLSESTGAFFARHRPALEAGVDGFYLAVLALALMGVTLAWLRRHWLALALVPQAVVLAVLYTVIFAEPRYRLPLFMLLLPFAVMALVFIAHTSVRLVRRCPPPGWRREAVLAVGCATAIFAAAPALAWAGARLREHHRWAVCECKVAGQPRFCQWHSLRSSADAAGARSLAGVWDGVGLPLWPGASSTATLVDLAPGDYTITWVSDITPRPAAQAELTGVLTVTADGQPVGEALPLAAVAAASRAGGGLAGTGRAHHPGGMLRLEAKLAIAPGQPLPSARLWLTGLEIRQ